MYGVVITHYKYDTDRRSGELKAYRKRIKDEVVAVYGSELDAEDKAKSEQALRERMYEEVNVVYIEEVAEDEDDE